MIEFRWQDGYLQYRLLFGPHEIGSGDIVLYEIKNPEWVNVPPNKMTYDGFNNA